MSEMVCDETVKEFLVESYENLDQLDRDFVALEADPSASSRIAAIFRTIHTIKGTSGFLGFGKLEQLTHAGESLLAKLRDGALQLTPPMTSALLALVDRVRGYLRQIEATGAEGPEESLELSERIHLLMVAGPLAAPAEEALARERPAAVAPASASHQSHPTPSIAESPPEPSRPATPLKAPEMTVAAPPAVAADPLRGDGERTQSAADGVAGAPGNGGATVSDSNVRVDVGLLDRLMNQVGELVLARNQILQFSASAEDAALVAACQRLNLITTELQEGVMKTRMQPIGNVWNKLPRVVRDLSIACGKQVRVEMHGKETDLDRTIIEAIKDPLTHIVRNAVDHGIEPPATRAARGKAVTGTLLLRAFHEGGQVNIEITDDGGGLDVHAISRKAVDRGLVSSERASRMSERELFQLVFVPGFSTAAKVSNVSGRGVGMDVVKTNIEKIGGTVDLQSQLGVGTTIKIKIPLTLAIVPALIVASRGHRFAIPQTSLLELARLEGPALRSIETIHGAPVYRLRGRLLPLVHLDRVLDLTERRTEEARTGDEQAVSVVVLQADDRQFGLVVDEVKDTEEIVVKPLGKELKSLTVFAGATIMGDGGVALILDVLGLAQRGRAVSNVRERALLAAEAESQSAAKTAEDAQSLLLFRVGVDGRLAIPLSMVARLEEFAPAQLERAGKQYVVQYRGQILPLIDVASALGDRRRVEEEIRAPVPVVVYACGGSSVGLIVDQLIDIVEQNVTIRQRSSRKGVLFAAIVHGHVTELLDVPAVLAAHGFGPPYGEVAA